jgi:2-methylfumaryl-CoA hydratase
MSFAIRLDKQTEVAGSVAVNIERARRPQYGRYLDEFIPGQVFVHPRGYTFDLGPMLNFARVFMQCNPLYLNLEYARAHGFPNIPASPQMVFNVVLSLGVQNDSEKAIANLGYYNVQFLHPVYPGDTLRGYTEVVERKVHSEDKPGIVSIRTLGLNQRNQVVLQYERKIMVDHRGDRLLTTSPSKTSFKFPWIEHPVVDLPFNINISFGELTGPSTYFEDFSPGDLIIHTNGRTITDEHMSWTYLVGNTHPLHFDRVYSTGLSGKMSGEPIVYGGLVFAWLEGLASRDVSENAVWELGYTEGYHTQPTVSGDTVAALSRVIATESIPITDKAGIVTFQLIGVKNITAAAALETYGLDLFVKENGKQKLNKAKINNKIFEIERRLLIKRRPV